MTSILKNYSFLKKKYFFKYIYFYILYINEIKKEFKYKKIIKEKKKF